MGGRKEKGPWVMEWGAVWHTFVLGCKAQWWPLLLWVIRCGSWACLCRCCRMKTYCSGGHGVLWQQRMCESCCPDSGRGLLASLGSAGFRKQAAVCWRAVGASGTTCWVTDFGVVSAHWSYGLFPAWTCNPERIRKKASYIEMCLTKHFKFITC